MESNSKSLISQALLSQISCKQDFYVIRGFSPSVEGLTAYHSHVVPCLILSKGLLDDKSYRKIMKGQYFGIWLSKFYRKYGGVYDWLKRIGINVGRGRNTYNRIFGNTFYFRKYNSILFEKKRTEKEPKCAICY